jgi:hypothetical protein
MRLGRRRCSSCQLSVVSWEEAADPSTPSAAADCARDDNSGEERLAKGENRIAKSGSLVLARNYNQQVS